ncbi:NADAR family protein [Sanyastnella coralliicola]|uniref:NADAR family protein n=1 Tax=Sanyastnella coralliicola TaxID=3069118 RepID=UPI0027BA21C5|nr:NADAR family protein [Longitalea sp. SCSIO 12813]
MILPGAKYRNAKALKVSGLIHFTWAFSERFDFVLPKGESFKVSYFNDPDDEEIQVWLDAPSKYEEMVVGEYLKAEKYDSYSLLLRKDQLESHCEALIRDMQVIYFDLTPESDHWLSSYSRNGFTFNDLYYPTVEHFFQSQKFTDPVHAERIRLASSSKVATELGNDMKHKTKNNWDEMKDDIMFLGVKLKFNQNPEMLNALIQTGETLIIANSPLDHYWGIGLDNTGRNHLGTLLMRVRLMALHNKE